MSEAEAFHDTNILLYLVSADAAKADVAEALIAGGGHVSVQVLNEFASIATRKFGMTWAAVADVLEVVRNVCRVHPLSPETHDGARAMLYSENLPADRKIEALTVRNPFHE